MSRSLLPPFSRLLMGFIFISFLLPSCRDPKDMVYKEIRNIKLEKLDFTNARLRGELVYFNPNAFGLELSHTDMDLYLDGKLLGHSTQHYALAIPKKADFVVPVSLDLDMKNLLRNGITALTRNKVNIRVVGKATLGKAGFFKTIPVDYTTQYTFNLF